MSWRVNAERLLLGAWSRAILLQLAHPLVAEGVANHSSFRSGPMMAARRLRSTVCAMLALTFADDRSRDGTIEAIRAIHRRVNGHLSETVGIYPAGTRYSAEDPALLLWVHATLVESMVTAYDLLVRPLSAHERDAYCDEARGVTADLGVPLVDLPANWPALVAFLDDTYRSDALEVGNVARRVGAAVLKPPFSAALWPLVSLNRVVTLGLLPDPIRRQYGHAWSARDGRRFARATRTLRTIRRLLPRQVAHWAAAR